MKMKPYKSQKEIYNARVGSWFLKLLLRAYIFRESKKELIDQCFFMAWTNLNLLKQVQLYRLIVFYSLNKFEPGGARETKKYAS